MEFKQEGFVVYNFKNKVYLDVYEGNTKLLNEAYIYDEIKEAQDDIEMEDCSYEYEIHKITKTISTDKIFNRKVKYEEKI